MNGRSVTVVLTDEQTRTAEFAAWQLREGDFAPNLSRGVRAVMHNGMAHYANVPCIACPHCKASHGAPWCFVKGKAINV